MSAYIEQSDVENLFGVDNVATWSNLEGTTGANTDRITKAIAYAEAIVNDSFRGGRYKVPFTTIPVVLQDWCSKLAGAWLFFSRPLYKKDDKDASDGFTDLREAVFTEMNVYAEGRRIFDAVKSATTDVGSPVVV